MNELLRIREVLRKERPAGIRHALATVTFVSGSAYRRPGARMLVNEHEVVTGAISGGCLEADIVQRSLQTIGSGVGDYVLYDSQLSNGDIVVELGCKGSVGVLIEPLPDPAFVCAEGALNAMRALELAATSQLNRKVCGIATVFMVCGSSPLEQGDRFALVPSSHIGETGAIQLPGQRELPPSHSEAIHSALLNCIHAGRSYSFTLTTELGEAGILCERITPPVSLILCGAGHDASPIVRFAQELGWQITVLEHRASLLPPGRFGHDVDCRITTVGVLPEDLKIDSDTAFVAMNHNYSADLEWVRSIARLPVGYLGVLGPKKRGDEIIAQITAEGTSPALSKLKKKLHSPAGLDIAAETPQEIAISVIAEIQATLMHASGGNLTNKQGPIHSETVHLSKTLTSQLEDASA